MARRSKRQMERGVSLDSLVDIVSNNVGILVLLAVLMALFALKTSKDEVRVPRSALLPPRLLEVPWSHPTNKQVIYFFMRDGRLQHIDLADFYRRLANTPVGSAPLDIQLPALTVQFFPVTNEVYCLSFKPRGDEVGETRIQTLRGDSQWQRIQTRYNAEAFVYYFWVAEDSFSWFRDLRQALWENQVEVGWKPWSGELPMALCNGFDDASAFRPQ